MNKCLGFLILFIITVSLASAFNTYAYGYVEVPVYPTIIRSIGGFTLEDVNGTNFISGVHVVLSKNMVIVDGVPYNVSFNLDTNSSAIPLVVLGRDIVYGVYTYNDAVNASVLTGIIVLNTSNWKALKYDVSLMYSGSPMAAPGLLPIVFPIFHYVVVDNDEEQLLPQGVVAYNMSIDGNSLPVYEYTYNLSSKTVLAPLQINVIFYAFYFLKSMNIYSKFVDIGIVRDNTVYFITVPKINNYVPVYVRPLMIRRDGENIEVLLATVYVGDKKEYIAYINNTAINVSLTLLQSYLLYGVLGEDRIYWRVYNLTSTNITSWAWLSVKEIKRLTSPDKVAHYLDQLGIPWNYTIGIPHYRDVEVENGCLKLYLDVSTHPGFIVSTNNTEVSYNIFTAYLFPYMLVPLVSGVYTSEITMNGWLNTTPPNTYIPPSYGAVFIIDDDSAYLVGTEKFSKDISSSFLGITLSGKEFLLESFTSLIDSATIIYSGQIGNIGGQMDPLSLVLVILLINFMSGGGGTGEGDTAQFMWEFGVAVPNSTQSDLTHTSPVISYPVIAPMKIIRESAILTSDYFDPKQYIVSNESVSLIYAQQEIEVNVKPVDADLTVEEKRIPLGIILENSNGKLLLSLNNTLFDPIFIKGRIPGLKHVIIGLSRVGDYLDTPRLSLFTTGEIIDVKRYSDRTTILLNKNATVYMVINGEYYKILKDGEEVVPTTRNGIIVVDPTNITIIWSPQSSIEYGAARLNAHSGSLGGYAEKYSLGILVIPSLLTAIIIATLLVIKKYYKHSQH